MEAEAPLIREKVWISLIHLIIVNVHKVTSMYLLDQHICLKDYERQNIYTAFMLMYLNVLPHLPAWANGLKLTVKFNYHRLKNSLVHSQFIPINLEWDFKFQKYSIPGNVLFFCFWLFVWRKYLFLSLPWQGLESKEDIGISISLYWLPVAVQ